MTPIYETYDCPKCGKEMARGRREMEGGFQVREYLCKFCGSKVVEHINRPEEFIADFEFIEQLGRDRPRLLKGGG